MRRAVQGLQKAGKTVSFFIGPYHPAVFKCEKPRICEGIRVMDPLIRKLAAELGVPVIGGFDPGIFGYTGDSFLDFQHLRGTELNRLRILGPDEATRSLEHVPAD